MAVSNAPTPILITDPSLRNFQNLYDQAYKTAKAELDAATKKLTTQSDELCLFAGNIRVAGHNLQNSEVKPIPSVIELKKQRNISRITYHLFVAVLAKMDLIQKKIPGILALLATQPASESAKTYIPLEYKESECSDQICIDYLSELKKASEKFDNLKANFKQAVEDQTLEYHIHRFSCLVDNAGLPLTPAKLTNNYVASSWLGSVVGYRYPVPMPEPESEEPSPPKVIEAEAKQRIILPASSEAKPKALAPLNEKPALTTHEEFERLFSSSSTTGEEEVKPNEAGTVSFKIAEEPVKPPAKETTLLKTDAKQSKPAEPPALGTTTVKIETAPPKPIEPAAQETAVVKTEAEKPKPAEPPVLTQLEPPAEEGAVVVKTVAEEPKSAEPPAQAAAVKTEPEEPKPTETPAVKADPNKPKEEWPAKEDRLSSRKGSRHRKSANKTEKT